MERAIQAGKSGTYTAAVKSTLSRHWWILALGAACAIGALLRLYRLDQLPPGLHYDEAFNGLSALRILETGDLQPFYAANSGREGMWFYLVALALRLGGDTALSLRSLSALVGILTVPITCAAGIAFFKRSARGRWIGLIAAAAMAVSYWHLNYSRISFRAILLPPFMLLSMAAFLVAWRSRRPATFALAGCLLGLSLYTYLAVRAAPFIILGFLILQVALILYHRRATPGHAVAAVQGWPRARSLALCLITYTLVATAVASPLIYYFSQHAGTFTGRLRSATPAAITSTETPVSTAGTLLGRMVETGRMFYERGDANPQHGLPYHPTLDWLSATLFSVGLIVALRRVGRPEYLLLLMWFAIMLLPVTLSDDPSNSLRGLGAQPAACLLIGIGGVWIAGQAATLARRISHRLPAADDFWAGLIFLSVLLVSGAGSAYSYFVAWPRQPELPQAFDSNWTAEAETIRQTTLTSDLYVPMELFTHPVVRYLLHERYPMLLPAVEPVDVKALHDPQMLFPSERGPLGPWVLLHTGDHPTAILLQPATASDWSRLVVALRERLTHAAPGAPVLNDGTIHRAVILPLSADDLAQLPRTDSPQQHLDTCFSNGVCLAGYTIEPAVGTSGVIYVTLFWRPTRLLDDSMGLFVHLIDRSGAVIAQDNALPTRNFYPGSIWSVGELIPDVRILAIPPGLAPGKVRFEVGVMGPGGHERLAVVDADGSNVADAVQFGAVQVAPNQVAEAAGAGAPGSLNRPASGPLPLRFGDGILLEGYDVARTARPADALAVTFHWRALGRIDKNYSIFVHLVDAASGAILAQGDHEPDAGKNPTSWWAPGEKVADGLTLTIPAGAAGKPLVLRIGWYGLGDGRRLPAFSPAGLQAGDSVDLNVP